MRALYKQEKPFRVVLSTMMIVGLASFVGGCDDSSGNGNGGDGDDDQADSSGPGDLPDSLETVTVSSYDEFQDALDEAAEIDEEDVDDGSAFFIRVAEDIDDGFEQNGALTYNGTVSLYIEGESEMRTLDADGHSRIIEIDSAPWDDDTPMWFSDLRFTNGVIADGAFEGGGAIDSDHPLVINHSEFENNSAEEDRGGAIYSASGKVEIYNSSFTGNVAERGGAVYMPDNDAEHVIVNSEFTNNESDRRGGALYGIQVSIQDSTFTENESTATGQFNRGGGAIHIAGGEIRNSEFKENTAGTIAGAVFHEYRMSLHIVDSEFVDNQAGNRGGAVGVFQSGSSDAEDASDVSVNVENSEFELNRHTSGGQIEGGAIVVSSGQGEVDIVSADSTYIDNDAPPLQVDTGELVDEGGNTFEPEEDRPDEW